MGSFKVSLYSLAHALCTLTALTLAADSSDCKLPLSPRTIYQFSDSSQWIENIAPRQNGDLLVTLAGPRAQLYLIENPSNSDKRRVSLLHDFGDTIAAAPHNNITSGPTVLVGLAEPRPDVFITAGGQLSRNRTSVPDTWSVFEIAFLDQTAKTAVRKVVDIPKAEYPNGVVAWPGPNNAPSSVVLIGDSTRGLVYRVDITENQITEAVHTDQMKPRDDGQPPFGINGMQARNGTLYFDNSNDRAFYSIAMTEDGKGIMKGASVNTVGSAEKVASFVDDFDIESDGTIWATSGSGNTLLALVPGTKNAVVVAGSKGSLEVGSPTAAKFGRGEDKGLYVVTAAVQQSAANGGAKEPGKVLRFDVSGFASCKSESSCSSSQSLGASSASRAAAAMTPSDSSRLRPLNMLAAGVSRPETPLLFVILLLYMWKLA